MPSKISSKKSLRIKVSVIMPARNAEASIDRAIQSVLDQKGIAFELLIGDDASTDGTWKRMHVYRSHPNVRIFHFRRRLGAAAARNRLIAAAKGIYLSICDADDRLLPGNLLILTRALDKRPAVGVVYGDLYVKSPGGKVQVKRRFVQGKAWDILGGYFPNGGALIRKDIMRKIGGYRSKFKFLVDCDLFVRLAEVTRFYYKQGKPLYFQYRSRGSLSDQSLKKQRQVSQMILRDAIQRRYGIRVK